MGNERRPQVKDLTGMKIGELTILEYSHTDDKRYAHWVAECSCEKKTRLIVHGSEIRRKKHPSCGCVNTLRKGNEYDLSGEYGIGYASNTGNEFYFDLEDYDKIKEHTWSERPDGYIANRHTADKLLHHFVRPDISVSRYYYVDHINYKKNDCRKKNLRKVTASQSNMNRPRQTNNSTGCAGVTYDKRRDRYYVRINVGGESIHLGQTNDYSEAVRLREEGETKYFGEYSYKNSQEVAS